MNEARQIVKDSVRATDKDAVIFAGSGSTSAITKLVAILGLTHRSTPVSSGGMLCSFPGCERAFTDEGTFKVRLRYLRSFLYSWLSSTSLSNNM